jgi:CheY-like chemotaxis protein
MKTLPNELRSDSDTFSQATIMMVDDELTTMEVMQAFLEDAGYQRFVLIEDSSQALEKLEEARPDILLLDLMMPKVTGFEILQLVRTHSLLAHLPVIILLHRMRRPNSKLLTRALRISWPSRSIPVN